MIPEERCWSWLLVTGDGHAHRTEVAGAQSRFDAEGWLGLRWRSLAERGFKRAVLLCDGERAGSDVELRGLGF